MDLSNKKLLLGIVIIVGFVIGGFTLSSILSEEAAGVCIVDGQCTHEQKLNDIYGLLPLLLSIALVVGAGTYYLMSGKIEKKDKSLKDNTKIILHFLNPDERKVVNKLIEGKGKVIQAEITRMEGMTKLKSHRITQKLIDRGVLKKESMGKTNILRFTKEIEEGLLD